MVGFGRHGPDQLVQIVVGWQPGRRGRRGLGCRRRGVRGRGRAVADRAAPRRPGMRWRCREGLRRRWEYGGPGGRVTPPDSPRPCRAGSEVWCCSPPSLGCVGASCPPSASATSTWTGERCPYLPTRDDRTRAGDRGRHRPTYPTAPVGKLMAH